MKNVLLCFHGPMRLNKHFTIYFVKYKLLSNSRNMLKIYISKFLTRLISKPKTKVFKINKKKNKQKFHVGESWKKFFDKCTLLGFHIIYGSRVYDNFSRITALLFLIVASVCCLYQCSNFILTYIRVPLKTAMVYNPARELTFPAITFCHTVFSRKSLMGPFYAGVDAQLMKFLTSFMADNKEEEKSLQDLVSIL